jgi:DNA-binding CsgD family transcriptional regulator
LLDTLYGAVLDDDVLPAALQGIAAFAGGSKTYYVTADRQTGAALSAAAFNVDSAVERQYAGYFGAKDLRIPPALAVPIGETVTEHRFVDPHSFKQSEILNDFLLPNDIPHIMAVWTRKTPQLLEAVSIQRSRRQGPFLKADEERCKVLIPHLVRALRIRQELQAVRQQQAVVMEVLDRLPFGVVLLDDAGRIIETSAAADAMLRSGDGVAAKGGAIRAALPEDDHGLQKAIRRTLRARADQLAPGGAVALRREGDRRALTVVVVPVADPSIFMHAVPRCMVLISDPDRVPPSAIGSVQRALGLTPAEARLACALFKGVSLREAAEELGLSINTCKAQLKSIYSKTGSRSHVELAKAVLFTALSASRDQCGGLCARDHVGVSLVHELKDYPDGLG